MAIEGIPESMQAAQVVEFKKPYKIHSIPTPSKLQPFEMLVRVAVASFCHTDMMVSEGIFPAKLPITASHEGSGTVVSLGSDVKNFNLGDRVLIAIMQERCHSCSDCKSAATQYCADVKRMSGVTADGSFAQYQVADARECCKLPDNLSFQSAAPLACAGITVYGGLMRLDLKPGQWIAIVGAGGGLGHLGVQMAKALDLKVIGIDARDEGLQLAKESGADVLIDARESSDSVISKVLEATGGSRASSGSPVGGADGTLNLSDANSAAGTACFVTKMHGTMVQIAQPPQVSIPFAELVFRDVKVVGSLIANREQTAEMLKLVADNEMKVRTNPFDGLDQMEKLVELAHSGKMSGKAVVLIDKEAIQKEKESGLKMV